MFPQHVLSGASCWPPVAPRKGSARRGKLYITEPNTSKIYFLEFLLLGTVNMRCKNWEKHTLRERIIQEKKIHYLNGRFHRTARFDHNYRQIVFTENVIMRFYCIRFSLYVNYQKPRRHQQRLFCVRFFKDVDVRGVVQSNLAKQENECEQAAYWKLPVAKFGPVSWLKLT